jgi:hypothetical protein
VSETTPVVVIGAARSGTNLLRDIICSFDGYGTWPCDEINYIWRHGNRDARTDELQPADATPEVVRYIRRAFEKQRRRQGGGVVVEKTCANSLRVPFVNQVVPEARFIFIVRDGRDVVASAMERWKAELDIPYLLRKARFVPPNDLPVYALRYLDSRLHRDDRSEKRLGWWGPRFEGMDELLETASLAELAAHQWKRSVDLANLSLKVLDWGRVHRMRYEDLVIEPTHELARLADFLETTLPPDMPTIKAGSVGRWRSVLSEWEQQCVGTIVRPSDERAES